MPNSEPSQDFGVEFKLGRHEPGLGMVEHRHPNVFSRILRGGEECLFMAPHEAHVQLVLTLAAALPSPFGFTYVLLVPLDSDLAGPKNIVANEGRYEIAEPIALETIAELFLRNRRFFESDARHHLEICSPSAQARIVYDQHNYIYASGPLDEFERVVRMAGLREGDAPLPSPHSHHYHPMFDRQAQDLLQSYQWEYSPLSAED